MIEISPNDNWNIRPKNVMKYWLSSRVHSALIVQTLFPIVFPGNFNEWRLPASAQSKPIECLQVKPHFTGQWIDLMCQMNWRNLDSFKSLLVKP